VSNNAAMVSALLGVAVSIVMVSILYGWLPARGPEQ